MKVIQLPAGYGKTIMSIHQAVNKKAPLIVKDDEQREKIHIFAENMYDCANCRLIREDCKELRIYTYDEFLELNSSGVFRDTELVIDDLDLLIKRVLNVNPDKLTITTK